MNILAELIPINVDLRPITRVEAAAGVGKGEAQRDVIALREVEIEGR